MSGKLVSAEAARALDAEASSSWGLSPFALVEAAGRECARLLTEAFPDLFPPPPPPGKAPSRGFRFPRLLVLAGGGNNGADALVLLRALILNHRASPGSSTVLVNRLPEEGEPNPRGEAFRALVKMGVPCRVWAGGIPEEVLRDREVPRDLDLVIDGIAGTGLDGPLRGTGAEMAAALNALREGGGEGRPPVVSVDIPSGLSGRWEPGAPLVEADVTLGIEPLKRCLYTPAARIYAGKILPVGGIFPAPLIGACEGAELLDWAGAAAAFPPVRADAYKHRRGTVEIHAGAPGSTGAARIAARGAQAAGAGLVRLMADRETYPVLAASEGGIMVVPPEGGEAAASPGRFRADALLLGPGWGRSPARRESLEEALGREAGGTPLVLDADAIHLARDRRFHGGAILTPHPGEFAALTGIPKEEIPADPVPLLLKTARERRAVILFKGCVLIIAAGDGRLGYVDGMAPVLAAGGTGDLLAGFCAAIAARSGASGGKPFDGYACAAAAAALLMETVRRMGPGKKFADPLELAGFAAEAAASAWLEG